MKIKILNTKDCSKPAIVWFIVSKSKLIWITYGECAIAVIGRNISDIKNGIHVCKGLMGVDIEIGYRIEEDPLMLAFNKEINDLTKNGYTILNNKKKSISYRAKIEIKLPFSKAKDSDTAYGLYRERRFVCVTLVTKGNKKKIVGIFDNKELAKSWMDVTYPEDKDITEIIYAKNYYTEFYRVLEKKGRKN